LHWTLTDAFSGAITDQRAALGLEIDKIRGVAAAVVKQRAFGKPDFNTGGERSKYCLVVSHSAEEIGGGRNAVARVTIKGGAKIENSELTDHNTALVGQTRVAKLMRVAEAAKDFLGKGESHV
jgi:hypothetical protein